MDGAPASFGGRAHHVLPGLADGNLKSDDAGGRRCPCQVRVLRPPRRLRLREVSEASEGSEGSEEVQSTTAAEIRRAISVLAAACSVSAHLSVQTVGCHPLI